MGRRCRMPPNGRSFTNGPSRPAIVVPNLTVRNAPHTAKGFGSGRTEEARIARQFIQPLTEKEKRARQVARMEKTANAGSYGGDSLGRNTVLSGSNSFFSPQLSTDFLELPQSQREKREIYRHLYNSDPI